MVFKRLRWLAGRNHRSSSSPKALTNHHHNQNIDPQNPISSTSSSKSQTLHEVAVYIHRFHNLDLFQQGWYQIKVSMRLEDNECTTIGTPARVVQYDAPELGCEGAYGVWVIDDTENSFLTQPFWIKYARQDVYLSIMVSFFLALSADEVPSASAVILKFELMYASALENGSELHASMSAFSAAVHEFRITPKALLGLHSYCPVHFDAFHAVLVDITVHICMMEASHKPPLKTLDNSASDFRQIMLIKALIAARDVLLGDLQKISKAIYQEIDLRKFLSNLDDAKFGSVMQSNLDSAADKSLQHQRWRPQNGAKDDPSNLFHYLTNQILFLWNTFLMFHRANKTKILEFLRDAWADDRKAEWSIWMVYSKIDMPNLHMRRKVDEPLSPSLSGKASSLRKLDDDPAHSANMRAELHRQSIAQMKINNRSLQDMYIFVDPSHIPIVMVERSVIVPLHACSGNSHGSHLEQQGAQHLDTGTSFGAAKKSSGSCLQQNDCVLKIVVFVHGFQGHHLDLRLVRNQWLLIDPKIEFLMSESNEDKTHGDFREMGLRLAGEVICFTKKKMDKVSRVGNLRDIKLSFVGHSIGNIIIRAALAESMMEPYLRYLYSYVSISGPHLGYLYSSNSLFNSGLWLLKKFKGTQCIHQLTFSDDPNLQKTFLYNLCKKKTLENFRNIILLSSPQDGYVPYHSARIESCSASFLDYSKKGIIFWEMLNECLNQIQAPSSENRVFMRCDINFDTSSHGRNLNTFIGRAAHVEFLESDIFVRFMMWSFPELFR